MKTALNLTWSQSRAYKCFCKSVGIKYDSEKREREERNEISLHRDFTTKKMTFWEKKEKAPDSISGMILKEASAVYITDLLDFVIKLLNEYDEMSLPKR